MPQDYDEKYAKWQGSDLPILPAPWQYTLTEKGRKQFEILKTLMNAPQVDTIVCATDAGREGELIFRLVYHQCGCDKPVKRLWISSLEETAIREGMDAVCQYYGIETADNSFGYIASWSKGRELKELKSSLETISHTANSIISEIDRNLAEIMAERGLQPLTQEIPGEQPPFDVQPEITSGQEAREITSASVIPSDQLMPDCGVALTMQDLWDYGYQENDLMPLTKEKPYALFDEDMAIYALYENGSADMVIDHGEITAHPGYFGIERDDWKQSRDYRDTLARHDAETAQLEQEFLSRTDEAELRDLADGVIDKLSALTDHEFAGISKTLVPDFMKE